jgi:hypothetical protein
MQAQLEDKIDNIDKILMLKEKNDANVMNRSLDGNLLFKH